jgi:hypothetical protein
MTTRLLTTVSAAIETATGIALIGIPALAGRALLGVSLSESGVAVVRLAGVALLSLGLACWPTADDITSSALRGLFVYNLLAAVYLGYLPASGEFAGFLLWPACALHAVLAVLFARPAFSAAKPARADKQ